MKRMAVFERRIVILYRIEKAAVWITNIMSGGRGIETLFDARGKSPPGKR